ncbi:MAG TPA: hypothetical protein VEU32_05145 [Burkholderiales bacterium]|nr:hypothetical protein [Burkholderiales bacterium]
MTQPWARWAAKFDELSLRERALVFVAAATLVAIVLYATAIQPELRQQRSLLERINLAQVQLKSINDELARNAQAAAHDPLLVKQERIRRLEERLAQAEKRITDRREAEQLKPEQLTRLLQDLLGENRGLHIVAMRVLPSTALALPAPAAASPGKGPRPPPLGAFYRHGIELEVSGTYLGLLKYLEAVEALPWRLAWAGVELQVTKYPEVLLRASLYTESPSQALLKY